MGVPLSWTIRCGPMSIDIAPGASETSGTSRATSGRLQPLSALRRTLTLSDRASQPPAGVGDIASRVAHPHHYDGRAGTSFPRCHGATDQLVGRPAISARRVSVLGSHLTP